MINNYFDKLVMVGADRWMREHPEAHQIRVLTDVAPLGTINMGQELTMAIALDSDARVIASFILPSYTKVDPPQPIEDVVTTRAAYREDAMQTGRVSLGTRQVSGTEVAQMLGVRDSMRSFSRTMDEVGSGLGTATERLGDLASHFPALQEWPAFQEWIDDAD